MKMLLQTIMNEPHFTGGVLYVDGKYQCFTLEDVVRSSGVKVQDETAIPMGTYRVAMTMSQRFGKVMPQLLNVPNFTGIRIHAGNTDHDTSGCILVGYTLSSVNDRPLTNSGDACDALIALIKSAADRNEEVTIEVRR
jgi:hypothetical protein